MRIVINLLNGRNIKVYFKYSGSLKNKFLIIKPLMNKIFYKNWWNGHTRNK